MGSRGRPTDSPKSYRRTVRLSQEDIDVLNKCAEKGYSISDVVRFGINEVRKRLIADNMSDVDDFIRFKKGQIDRLSAYFEYTADIFKNGKPINIDKD